MKKLVLALVAMLASAAFAPVANALPVFARQTGFACTQCHFQHFPLLNAFGRSFKAGGYTMMGSQPLVEGEHLSIPNTLNFGVLTTLGAEKVSQDDPTVASQDSFNTPAGGGELSLFYGGRISENIGFLTELGAAGAAKTSSAKMPIFYEVAEGTRAGVVFLTTSGQGAAHSFETLNTGAVAVHRMAPMPGANSAHIKVNSAAQYLGTNTGAQGASLVVNNDNYFVNVGKYKMTPKDTDIGSSTKGGTMRMTYMRAAAMFDVAGFDSAVGVQAFRGDDGVEGTLKATEATIIDAQMQGKVGEMPLGVYASYGTAPVVDGNGVTGNHFNTGGAETASSMNIAAEIGVVPGVTTVMAAMRMGKNGKLSGADSVTDNALMLGVTYELAMNVEASLSHTMQSGKAWDVDPATGYEPAGKTVTSLMLEALF